MKNGSAKWDYSSAEGILLGAEEMGWTMSQGMYDPDAPVILGSDEMFKGVFGNTTLVKENAREPGKYFGYTEGSTISFYGNYRDSLIFHEFGHRFDGRGNEAPTSLLGGTQIYDINGNFVTGYRNGGYDRGGGVNAPDPRSGYAGNSCPYQCHPRGMDGGNSANEEWADMFMNYVQGIFVSNPAGNALSAWVTTNMTDFIVAASR